MEDVLLHFVPTVVIVFLAMLLSLLASATTAAALTIAAKGYQFSGALSADNSSATICINGTVDQNSYIGFAIAQKPKTMTGADLTIAYADETGAVKILHGSGAAGPRYLQDPGMSPLTTTTNSYTGGNLNACFSRPLAGNGTVLPLSSNGTMNFLWASGPVNNGVPLKHIAKGAFDGNIFAKDAASPSASGTAQASASSNSVAALSILGTTGAMGVGLMAALLA
ncbi:hypothetical protein BC830DRAFT_1163729 [Chytriomyces sp. MP71]|nr:hypothetical protein BC830DRAFT_1163729 [Chytriomyces sp. MP71]